MPRTATSARRPSSRSRRRRPSRASSSREVAALGYDMVLGNTFHLFLDAGPRADRAARRAARVHALGRARSSPTPAASRSSRWATAPWPTRSRAASRVRGRPPGAILSIEEEGVRFRSYVDGSTRFMAPETSMEVQAALAPTSRSSFDECTPFHVDREYTQRSTERRTAGSPLPAMARRARSRGPAVTGSCRAASRRTCGASRRRRWPRATSTGSRSAARSAPTRRRCSRSSTGRSRSCRGPAAAPARHRRDRRPRARRRARDRHLRLRDADAARPPRHGDRPRPGAAAGASTSPRRAGRSRRAADGGLPVPGLRRGLHARLPALPVQGQGADRACGCSRSTTWRTCSG